MTDQSAAEAVVRAENVGGIHATEVHFEPGVTVLAGRNATNRTSLLHAIETALGAHDPPLRAGTERGAVELRVNGATYTRDLQRTPHGIDTDGDPLLQDPAVAETFAFLLESNPARRAVREGGDLREVILAPVDVEALEAEIDRLLRERREVDDRLAELDDLDDRHAELERERDRLTTEIETTRSELDAAEADLTVSETSDSGDLDDRLAERRERRSERDTLDRRLATERESLTALREEREELDGAHNDAPDPTDRDRLETRIADLRDRAATLESRISRLGTVVSMNESLLEGGTFTAGTDSPTDRLVGEEVTCWTCGSTVSDEDIEGSLEELRDLQRELREEHAALRDELDDCTERRDRIEEEIAAHERREQRLSRIEDEIEEREATVAELTERRDELEGEIEALDRDIETLREAEQETVVDRHREASDLAVELERLTDERERVESNLDSVAAAREERADLEAKRDRLASELEAARTRIERTEREAVAAFNREMATVVDLLGFDNIARIWLERGDESFDLHVVRETDSGAAFEDTVAHLSESEREVTGLVFALAGYLAHEVHETVPFLLLDSLEAIDGERIAALVDHFAGHAEYVVTALLPEDAAALDSAYPRVSDI